MIEKMEKKDGENWKNKIEGIGKTRLIGLIIFEVKVEKARLSKIDKTRFKRLLNCSIVAIA